MGARLYVPSIGRFLQTDPITGGSATAYDYCNGDPVNCTDLDGTVPDWLKKTGKWIYDHRGMIATVAATAACFVPAVGWAARSRLRIAIVTWNERVYRR